MGGGGGGEWGGKGGVDGGRGGGLLIHVLMCTYKDYDGIELKIISLLILLIIMKTKLIPVLLIVMRRNEK